VNAIKTPADLGKIIRQRRKAAKLTQQKAAALAGIGVRFLSELERGKPTAQIGNANRKSNQSRTIVGLGDSDQ